MVGHAGRREPGKSFKGGLSKAPEIGIIRRLEGGARAQLDLVPINAIEPAVLIGATTDRQDDRRRQSAVIAPMSRELQRFDQLHVGLDCRLLLLRR